MMRNKLYLLMPIFTLLVACSGSNEPSEDKLRTSFILQHNKLLKVLDVGKFNVEVSENIGTEVEPLIKSRIVTNFKLKRDIYNTTDYIDGRPVLKKSYPKGHTVPASIISTSKLSAGKWDTKFDKPQFSEELIGRPLSSYSGDDHVIKDSNEHKKLAAERKAEEERLIKKRAEAKKELLKKMKVSRQKIAGTWASEKPIISKGKYVTVKMHREYYKLMYKITIPKGEENSGNAKVTFFTKPKTNSVSLDAQFQLEHPSVLYVKELERIKIGDTYGKRWTTGDTWAFTINNGEFDATIPGSRNNVSMTLKKKQ